MLVSENTFSFNLSGNVDKFFMNFSYTQNPHETENPKSHTKCISLTSNVC